MSTIVSDITTGGRVVIAAVLGATYKKLDYQRPSQFLKNKFGGKFKRYAWVPSLAINDDQVAPIGHQAFNQTFSFTLMTDYVNQDDDTKQEIAELYLYSQILEVVKELRKTKINGISAVTNVSISEIADPEYLDDNSCLVIVSSVIVQYRYRI